MKATIDIPDELYRRVKARSALLGLAVREVTIDLYRRWLGETASNTAALSQEQWLDEWLRLGSTLVPGGNVGPTASEIVKAGRDRLDPR